MSRLSVPPAFRARFSDHNRSAILFSILAAMLALVGWVVVYFCVYWLTLFIGTIIYADQATVPPWLPYALLGGALLLLVLAALDHALFRFSPIHDRPLIGVHLIKDILLALPRLTFSVFGNLMACRRLSQDDLRRAWELLLRIQKSGKSDVFTLSQVEPDARRLNALLLALQMTGFINLHRGEESWFYLVCSDQEDAVRGMMADEEETAD